MLAVRHPAEKQDVESPDRTGLATRLQPARPGTAPLGCVTLPDELRPARRGRPRRGPRRAVGAVAALVAGSLTAAALSAGPAHAHEPVPAGTAAAPGRAAGHRAPALDPGLLGSTGVVRVVVSAARGGARAAAAAVRRHGGTVTAQLDLVDGVAARVPAGALRAVAADPAVRAVTADRTVHFSSLSAGAAGAAAGAQLAASTSLNAVADTGAANAWRAGFLGDGQTVAVLDTGVSPHNDLANRVDYGPDLSGENSPSSDSYGHGTVMAGLVAGDGTDSAGSYTGIAPHARIVSVKTAGANGSVDVSTMLAAMHWVLAYKDQFHIGVLSLSWGVPSTQDPTLDPLDYAVERLWSAGIVVVVAAGNSGPNAGTILTPGADPVVLTVGAYDDSAGAAAATVPAWSSQGPTAQGYAKPDVVDPGRLLVSPVNPASYIATTYPNAVRAPDYIRGSGTSQATAITAGVVALLRQARPTLTPDQVKAVLTGTAAPLPGVASSVQGAGAVVLTKAMTAAAGPATQQQSVATGLGSLELSRGGLHLQTVCPGASVAVTISGEVTDHCVPWSPASWTGTSWTGTSWTGTSWTGTSWTGTSWTGTSWTGTSWTGTSWTGTSWTSNSWSGTSWTGTSWTGTSWTGTSWTGTSWTGTSWTSEPDGFQTAFWGDAPRSWQHVHGEMSQPDAFPGAVACRGCTAAQ